MNPRDSDRPSSDPRGRQHAAAPGGPGPVDRRRATVRLGRGHGRHRARGPSGTDGAARRARRDVREGQSGKPLRSGASHLRPPRNACRRGGVPPRLSRPDGARHLRPDAQLRLAPRGRSGPRGPVHPDLHVQPARGRGDVPDGHDLFGSALPAHDAPDRGGMDAADPVHRLRPPRCSRAGEDRGHGRHVHDREAGRLGRARECDGRGAGARGPVRGRCAIPVDGAQVLLLRADVRRLPGARQYRGLGASPASSCPAGGPTGPATTSSSRE